MIECGTLSSLVGATVSWPTAASLATAGGTLVLALATFASVRSSNRSARIAELALQEQRRPVLVQSRPDDPVQKIMFIDGHWVRVSGSGGVAEHIDGNVYLVMSLRNVGAGIGVAGCERGVSQDDSGWLVAPDCAADRLAHRHHPVRLVAAGARPRGGGPRRRHRGYYRDLALDVEAA